MIDEIKIQCFACCQWGYMMVFDPERHIYFCPDCCAQVGREPPFTQQELLKLTLDKRPKKSIMRDNER